MDPDYTRPTYVEPLREDLIEELLDTFPRWVEYIKKTDPEFEHVSLTDLEAAANAMRRVVADVVVYSGGG
jgi:hypothetical protein